MSSLIDSTEMYLRTLYELREEDVRPLRARLVERLRLSAPAVSEATARLAATGLVEVGTDRMVHLTPPGLARATQVMRKHRLAELLLSEVIGLDWRLVHTEACRWEHVISDDVEQRLTVVLGDPGRCPHGNRIPPASGLDTASAEPAPPEGSAPLSLLAAADGSGTQVRVDWLSESLQTDDAAMDRLYTARLLPGTLVHVTPVEGGVRVFPDGSSAGREAERALAGADRDGAPDPVELAAAVAGLIYVRPDEAGP